MIYIKRIYSQDIERTPTFSTEAVNSFFGIDIDNGQEETKQIINLSTNGNFNIIFKKRETRNEYRIFLNELFAEISPSIDDLLIIRKTGAKSFSVKHINDQDPLHSNINSLIASSNHELVLTDNQLIFEEESETGEFYFNEDPPVKKIPIPLNQILYGPPGTGKTYSTIERALKILDRESKETNVQKQLEENRETFKSLLNKKIFFVTMHPSYGYEDFVQGIRPKTNDKGDLIFEPKNGIFKLVAKKAHDMSLDDGLITETDFENRDVAKLCFFMAKFNTKDEQKANSVIGKNSNKEVYELLSEISGQNKNSLKRKRDSFDHFFTHREGNQRKDGRKILSNSEQEVFDELKDKTFEDVAGIVNEILKKPVEEKKVTEENQNFVLILDEINRANISKVFGELITLLEEDKRIGGENELSVTLPSGEEFSVPPNLYIIGTMNTADKSISLVDIALRRRFQFEALYPDPSVIDKFGKVAKIEKKQLMENLNQKLIEPDGEFFKGVDFQIGHAYFMKDNSLNDVVDQNIIPLLTEYFRNDLQKVKTLLDACSHKIDNDHFEKTGLLRSK